MKRRLPKKKRKEVILTHRVTADFKGRLAGLMDLYKFKSYGELIEDMYRIYVKAKKQEIMTDSEEGDWCIRRQKRAELKPVW